MAKKRFTARQRKAYWVPIGSIGRIFSYLDRYCGVAQSATPLLYAVLLLRGIRNYPYAVVYYYHLLP